MNIILAAILALATVPASPLPGAPRAVTVAHAAEGLVVSWQAPARSGETPITGYVVLAGETATLVDAQTTRLVVPTASGVAVASLNGVGSSTATKARLADSSRGTRPVTIARRAGSNG